MDKPTLRSLEDSIWKLVPENKSSKGHESYKLSTVQVKRHASYRHIDEVCAMMQNDELDNSDKKQRRLQRCLQHYIRRTCFTG